jgi:hypothetical protein
MMTAIALLKTLALVLAALVGRAALVLAVIAVLAIPIVLFAYTVRAIETAWHRRHDLRHAHHHV